MDETRETQELTQEQQQEHGQGQSPTEQPNFFDREARRADEVIPFGDEPQEPDVQPEPPEQSAVTEQPTTPPPQQQAPALTLDELVRRDPNLGRVVEGYLRQRMGLEQAQPAPPMTQQFEIKPLAEYDDEAAWLRDHMQRYREHLMAEMEARQRLQVQQAVQQQRIEAIRAALFARDPEHAATVIPRLEEHGRSLPPERLAKINAFDMSEIIRFYDEVRSKIIGGSAQQPVKQPQWRVRSSRSMATTPPSNDPWNMSREEFEARIAAAKGY